MSLVQKNVQRNYVLNVYLSFGRVKTHTCPTVKITCLRIVDTVSFRILLMKLYILYQVQVKRSKNQHCAQTCQRVATI